jgi:hypothetical protein
MSSVHTCINISNLLSPSPRTGNVKCGIGYTFIDIGNRSLYIHIIDYYGRPVHS